MRFVGSLCETCGSAHLAAQTSAVGASCGRPVAPEVEVVTQPGVVPPVQDGDGLQRRVTGDDGR